MRFIFITDELPRPGRAGHLALNHAILSWLQSLGHEVTILLTGARLRWPAESYRQFPVAGPAIRQTGSFITVTSPTAQLRQMARAALRSLPSALQGKLRQRVHHGADAVLGSFIGPAHAAWCAAYIRRKPPDAILVDTIFRAAILREPGITEINSVIIAHDVFHRRHAALMSAGYQVQPAALSRAMEAEWLQSARAVAAIQPDEAAVIQTLCPGQNVFTAPMPALPCPRPDGTKRLAGRLVFIGSAALPNIDGLRWFFDTVWPQLQRWRGERITLDLIGDCGAALPLLPKNVTRLGRVEDLAPALHRAALAIAPMRIGSGLKIKLLDYARHGLCTIATPASLQGFAADSAAPFIAADNAAAFAACIIRSLDTAITHEQRALSYISRHYGMEASFSRLAAALVLPRSLHSPQLAVTPFPPN